MWRSQWKQVERPAPENLINHTLHVIVICTKNFVI